MSPPRLGPRGFLWLCRTTLAAVVLNILTGAAVRLSDSGLGCPDWPNCTKTRLTPPLRLHALIEFGNRMVVVVLVVLCGLTLVAAWLRRPGRRDLTWLAGGLILGVLGEAVLGAFVVYSKLNPYVVMTHFMVGMALLGVAVLLALRADHAKGRGITSVSSVPLWLMRVVVGLVVVVLVAGTATTGAGPHAGGKGAKRVPIGLEEMTRIHAELALGTALVVLVLLWSLWRTDAPADVQRAGQTFLAVVVAQGLLGYSQFFTHLPPVLVGIHVLGASTVWAAALWFHHGMSSHEQEPSVGLASPTGTAAERPLVHAP